MQKHASAILRHCDMQLRMTCPDSKRSSHNNRRDNFLLESLDSPFSLNSILAFITPAPLFSSRKRFILFRDWTSTWYIIYIPESLLHRWLISHRPTFAQPPLSSLEANKKRREKKIRSRTGPLIFVLVPSPSANRFPPIFLSFSSRWTPVPPNGYWFPSHLVLLWGASENQHSDLEQSGVNCRRESRRMRADLIRRFGEKTCTSVTIVHRDRLVSFWVDLDLVFFLSFAARPLSDSSMPRMPDLLLHGGNHLPRRRICSMQTPPASPSCSVQHLSRTFSEAFEIDSNDPTMAYFGDDEVFSRDTAAHPVGSRSTLPPRQRRRRKRSSSLRDSKKINWNVDNFYSEREKLDIKNIIKTVSWFYKLYHSVTK